MPKTKHPKPSAHSLSVLRSIRAIIRAVDIHSHKLKQQFEITSPQLVALINICERGELSLAALAKDVHLSPSTMVGIVDRLEAKQLVTRERSTEDRRQIVVRPTKKGRDFAESAPSPLQETLAMALQKLPASEQEEIAAALERIVRMIHAESIDAAPILAVGSIDKA